MEVITQILNSKSATIYLLDENTAFTNTLAEQERIINNIYDGIGIIGKLGFDVTKNEVGFMDYPDVTFPSFTIRGYDCKWTLESYDLSDTDNTYSLILNDRTEGTEITFVSDIDYFGIVYASSDQTVKAFTTTNWIYSTTCQLSYTIPALAYKHTTEETVKTLPVSFYNSEITLSGDGLELEGYELVGFTDGTNNYNVNAKYTIIEDVTLTCKYEPIKRNFTITTNGGYLVNYSTYSAGKNSANYGTKVVLPTSSQIEKIGSTFGGWYTDSSFTNVAKTSYDLTENITVYAKFTFDKETVRTGEYKITDSGRFNQDYDTINFTTYGIDISDMIAKGYKTVTIHIKFTAWDVYDGYRYVWIYDGSSSSANSFKGFEFLIDDDNTETFTFDFTDISLSKISSDKVYVRYGADGDYEDTWRNSKLYVWFEFSK